MIDIGKNNAQTVMSEKARLVMKRSGMLRRFSFLWTAKSTKELPKVPMTLASAQTTERIMASSLVKNVLRRGTVVVS